MKQITYELALKLKLAGFPQRVENDGISMPMEADRESTEWFNSKDVYYPSVEELIEECGGDSMFIRLENNFENSTYIDWCAIAYIDSELVELRKGNGTTIKEALSNLYLELHNE